MQQNLTEGAITKKQQLYNIVDTLIVGRVLGKIALGAVGASFTLMTFLNSIIIGLCMGSSAYFSMQYGKKDLDRLRQSKSFLPIYYVPWAIPLFHCCFWGCLRYSIFSWTCFALSN